MQPEVITALAAAASTAANVAEVPAVPTYGWDSAPQWVRDTYLSLVQAVFDESMTYALLHERWMTLMAGNGWSLGTYDADAKTHPRMKAWAELTLDDQKWMTFFMDTAKGLKNVVEALAWSPR